MRRGFTLLEFVVILIILAILAAILFPILSKSPHNSPRSSCQSNLKQIELGFAQYVQDYDERMPLLSSGSQGWAESVQPYLKSWQIFHCPSGEKTYDQNEPLSMDYFLNARVAGLKRSRISSGAQTLLLGEGFDGGPTNSHFSELPLDWIRAETSPAKRHLDGANYAWVDGHVKWLKPDQISVQSPQRGGSRIATFAVR